MKPIVYTVVFNDDPLNPVYCRVDLGDPFEQEIQRDMKSACGLTRMPYGLKEQQ